MIHYHGCPISGGESTQLAYSGKHAMISFCGQSYAELIIEVCQSFTIDNGAFGYWKSGKEFPMEEFAVWLEQYYRHPSFDWYCLPDVIDGDHNDNARMRARWFKHVDGDMYKKGYPVWHMHEPLEVLRDMVSAYPGVCIGSSGEYSKIGTDEWWSRITEAMPYVTDEQGRPVIKLHGLRQLDNTISSHIPYSSCDSTNVARNAGMDGRWTGPYVPKTNSMRALLMMDRIENHASASRWNPDAGGIKSNFQLFG